MLGQWAKSMIAKSADAIYGWSAKAQSVRWAETIFLIWAKTTFTPWAKTIFTQWVETMFTQWAETILMWWANIAPWPRSYLWQNGWHGISNDVLACHELQLWWPCLMKVSANRYQEPWLLRMLQCWLICIMAIGHHDRLTMLGNMFTANGLLCISRISPTALYGSAFMGLYTASAILLITSCWANTWIAVTASPRCTHANQIGCQALCVHSQYATNAHWPGIAGLLYAPMRQALLVRYIRVGATDSCRVTVAPLPPIFLLHHYILPLPAFASLIHSHFVLYIYIH